MYHSRDSASCCLFQVDNHTDTRARTQRPASASLARYYESMYGTAGWCIMLLDLPEISSHLDATNPVLCSRHPSQIRDYQLSQSSVHAERREREMTDVHVHVRLKRLRAPWAASSLDLGEEHLGRVKVCIVTVEPTVGHHLDRRAQTRRLTRTDLGSGRAHVWLEHEVRVRERLLKPVASLARAHRLLEPCARCSVRLEFRLEGELCLRLRLAPCLAARMLSALSNRIGGRWAPVRLLDAPGWRSLSKRRDEAWLQGW